jgi:5-methylcytosine-specific restriction protein B
VFGPTVKQAPAVAPDAFEIVAKPSHLKYARFIVPSQLAQEFDALTNPETKRIDLRVPGLPMASMSFYKSSERGNLFYVLLSGEVKDWFTSSIELGGRFLLARKTSGEKEWLELTLPSGGQQGLSSGDKTYELIAVRPDWTDARALLGFYNPLTKSYISTPTLQLLLRAHAEVKASTDAALPRPFFLIFDEMNLARVEHYFSDFLSAMESMEAIHLHDDPQVEEEEDIPRRITIPKNVFVIGTVNVDETTYMFSPKVLDRAFVLEFNDVDLKGLAGAVHAEASESTPLALVNLEGGLKLRGPATNAEWQRFERALNGEASALLHKFHAALAIENRHFGYRVAREVARFVDFAIEQTDGKDAAQRAALDVAVLAKILPKLHGSQAEVEQTLKRLMMIAIGERADAEVFAEDGALVAGVEVPLPRTARKLWRMLRRLRASGFVSFIE